MPAPMNNMRILDGDRIKKEEVPRIVLDKLLVLLKMLALGSTFDSPMARRKNSSSTKYE